MIKNVATHPELANIQLGNATLKYTRHALERLKSKRIYWAPKQINISAGTVVELEQTYKGKCSKLVVRLPYEKDNSKDQVFVLRPESHSTGVLLVVVTLWLNHASDTHSTLNLDRIYDSEYETEEEE